MIDRIRRGIPAYLDETDGGAEMFPQGPWDDPVLVDLQSIACQAGVGRMTEVQRADVLRQVTLRANYLHAVASAARAIRADLVAHLDATQPAPPAPGAMPPATSPTGESPVETPTGPPRIESDPTAVEGVESLNPADIPAKPRHRPRNLK